MALVLAARIENAIVSPVTGLYSNLEEFQGLTSKLIRRLGGAIGASLPLACQDWANTKAAYRFFSNGRISEDQILAGHFHSWWPAGTVKRFRRNSSL